MSYYSPTGNPGTSAAGLSATIRAEFAAIAAGFALLPNFAGNANKIVVVNSTGTALTVTSSPDFGSPTFDTLHVTGAATFDSSINVSGIATLGSLHVTGTSLFDNSIHVNGIQDGSGGQVSILGGVAITSGNLSVSGSGSFTGALTAGTTITATNQITGGSLHVTGTSFLNDVNVTGVMPASATGVSTPTLENLPTLDFLGSTINFQRKVTTGAPLYSGVRVFLENLSSGFTVEAWGGYAAMPAFYTQATSHAGSNGSTVAFQANLLSQGNNPFVSQDVAGAFTVVKTGQNSTWGIAVQSQDNTGLAPGAFASNGAELDILANGPDSPQSYYDYTLANRTGLFIAAKNNPTNTWSSNHAFDIGTIVLGTPSAGVSTCYIAQNAGTTGSSMPTWPTSGSFVDGTITWQTGVANAMTLGTGIYVGAPTINTVFGSDAVIGNAGIDFSKGSLADPATGAGIRLRSDMGIDFTGNGTAMGKNQRVLLYSNFLAALIYQTPAGVVTAWNNDTSFQINGRVLIGPGPNGNLAGISTGFSDVGLTIGRNQSTFGEIDMITGSGGIMFSATNGSGVVGAGYLTASAAGVSLPGTLTAGNIVYGVPPGGSIQAAIDALPSTGGEVRLSPNTTYVITTGIVSTKDNVHISAPGWGTVIQRGASMGGSTPQQRTVLQLSGMGCLVEGMTFDGNGSANITGYAEILVSGTHSRVTGVQVINCAGEINIGVSGSDSRVDHCTVVGFGILSTLRCYGIWGIPGSHNRLQIDNNVVTNTNNDGIGASGSGATISGNTVSGCHCYLLSGGGQIQIYPNTDADASVIVAGNHIGQGGGAFASGLILFGNNITATGNTIINQYGVGIGLEDGNGFTITGNTILNTGLDMSGTQDGIVIGGVNDFVISGNTIGDNQLTPTMQWAINVTSGVSGRYTIVGNECGPCTNSSVIHDAGTGTAKVVANNGGVPPFDFVNVPALGIRYNTANSIAFQWNGSNVQVYVDGTLHGTIP